MAFPGTLLYFIGIIRTNCIYIFLNVLYKKYGRFVRLSCLPEKWFVLIEFMAWNKGMVRFVEVCSISKKERFAL